MRVGIAGGGVVGTAQAKLFERVCDVRVYDPNVPDLSMNAESVRDADALFVCVPTPQAGDGSCDVSTVEEVVSWSRSDLIVIRSTVAPGTTDRLAARYRRAVVFQPEYLGETVAHPLVEQGERSFAVLGGHRQARRWAADLYRKVYNSSVRFYLVEAIVAELAKYMENAFYAAKVTFCNAMYDACEAFNAEYDEVREVWLADPRVSRDHTFVHPADRGFGGKCLPKDLFALIAACRERGREPAFLEAIRAINEQERTRACD